MINAVEKSKYLFPGATVQTSAGPATVYPVGVVHLRQFTSKMTRIIQILGTVRVTPGASNEQRGKEAMVQVAPFLLDECLDIVTACVRFENDDVKLEDLPHWDLPVVLEAWFVESFGEERKWRPWVQAIESTVRKCTGKEVRISEMLSNSSSPAATASAPS